MPETYAGEKGYDAWRIGRKTGRTFGEMKPLGPGTYTTMGGYEATIHIRGDFSRGDTSEWIGHIEGMGFVGWTNEGKHTQGCRAFDLVMTEKDALESQRRLQIKEQAFQCGGAFADGSMALLEELLEFLFDLEYERLEERLGQLRAKRQARDM